MSGDLFILPFEDLAKQLGFQCIRKAKGPLPIGVWLASRMATGNGKNCSS
jgi:hypothetical protein